MLFPIQYKIKGNGYIATRQVEGLGEGNHVSRIIYGYADGSQIVGGWDYTPAVLLVKNLRQFENFYPIEEMSHVTDLPTSEEMETMRLGGDIKHIMDIIEDPIHDGYAKHLLVMGDDDIIHKTGIGGEEDFLREVWLNKPYLERDGFATIYTMGPFLITKVLWYDL